MNWSGHTPFYRDYTLKMVYLHLMVERLGEEQPWWWKPLWKIKFPIKSWLFMWCILENKVLISYNLQKRQFEVHLVGALFVGMRLRQFNTFLFVVPTPRTIGICAKINSPWKLNGKIEVNWKLGRGGPRTEPTIFFGLFPCLCVDAFG